MKLKKIGKPIVRKDAADKISGRTKYPSDFYFKDMIYCCVLRSKYPHAEIISINTAKAEKFPGVVKVLTHKDVTGLNAYGIAVQDQPVFCDKKVRYLGDAISCVGAQSEEIARKAMELIEVEYKVLPVVTDPETAMKDSELKVHDKGNLLHEMHFENGNLVKTFESADLILEDTYSTPRQEHLFLETESGVAYYDDDGLLTVIAGGQYPHRDQMQIARSLGIQREEVRVIACPIGGGFGGKDEITVQIYIALMTYLTKRSSRIFLDREESLIAGMKRHPMKVSLKTSFKKDGTITGLLGRIVSDKGAYASLGGPVLNLTVEHLCGPYKVPNNKIDGYAVYTNNGFGAAFRGFGVPQACFAIETQVDEASRRLKIDPIDIRLKNCLKRGDTTGLGCKMNLSVGTENILKKAKECDLYLNREKYKNDLSDVPAYKRDRIRRGFGIACAMQGCGLGVGLPDYAVSKVRLKDDGKFEVVIGGCEMGQGNHIAMAQIAAEALVTHEDNIDVIVGDTKYCPDGGPSTASRTIYAMGNAVKSASLDFRSKLFEKLGIEDKGQEIKEGKIKDGKGIISIREDAKETIGEANFLVPTAQVELGDGLPHILYCYGAQLVIVEIDTFTGAVEVKNFTSILDSGRVINSLGLEGQSEGGAIMGMGYALTEDIIIENGEYRNPHLSTYIILTAKDLPEKLETIPVEVFEETGPYYAKGIGEMVMVPTAPAITNAIYDAIGVRFNKIPVTPEMVLKELNKKQ